MGGVPPQNDSETPRDPFGDYGIRDGVSQLAEGVERLMHLTLRARQHMLDKASQDVDWSTLILMNALVAHGPMRVKELAELAQSDPSTVSRHVAQLVRDGFLERHADAVDGRASVLTATDKARHAVDERKERRNLHYAQMLSAWEDRDRDQLATLLSRFIDDFLTYKTTLADSDWTHVRPASRKENTS
jgi:DNA-binding MarR family transcriptional regulator